MSFRLVFALLAAAMLGSCGGDSAPSPAPPTVVTPPPKVIPVNVTFSADSVELIDDLTSTEVPFTVSPANVDSTGLAFSTSDQRVFTVDNRNGLQVTAVARGSARLIATHNGVEVGSLPIEVRDVRMYSIGNSHTVNFGVREGFSRFAYSLGIGIDGDYHIYCGQSLTRILAEPDNTCVSPKKAKFRTAFQDTAYDIVTIQTFPGVATAEEEARSVGAMIAHIRQSASSEARIFVYVTWPPNTAAILADFDYSASWRQGGFDPMTGRPTTQAFSDYLETYLSQEGIAVDGFIQGGRMLALLHDRAASGEIPGLHGAGLLYRDTLHVTNIGRYYMGATVIYNLFPEASVVGTDLPNIPGYSRDGRYPADMDWNAELHSALISLLEENARQPDR